MHDFLLFEPLYQERVWGGRAFETELGRSLPSGCHYGESWELVDRGSVQSVVVEGHWRGRTLRELLECESETVMGPGWSSGQEFPLLLKWLDCREAASLQVHPPADVAAQLGGAPKTENWFFAATGREAAAWVGFKSGVTRETFEQAQKAGVVEPLIERFSVAAGDSVLVPSGTVHSVDAGSVILEVQQNSDTTYRIYDWGRLGLDGRPRQMHFEQAMQSIRWGETPPLPVHATAPDGLIAQCPEFSIRRQRLEAGERLMIAAREQPRLLHVITGEVVSGTGRKLARADNALLPYAGSFVFSAQEPSLVLVTEGFSG